ncbi:carbohydrate ABC transporter permease [Brachybacterium sp. J144]|uniref:carbohydrate ABC transporter permease n=1 Tax=Brachybacterium sp. J144 TaxID=3116487 RepID=UPI002E797838|nr:carbohydrate ABC transporter permease [Brachybacterium sp. J144]MEE1650628.1 carbohydrate ABC transporter permease [Brachybacterium sp. J144]
MSAANPTSPTADATVGSRSGSTGGASARPGAADGGRRRRRTDPARVVAFVILAVLALLWLVPVLWAALTSFKTEAEAAAMPVTIIPENGFTLDAYLTVLTSGQVPRWAWNSLITSTAVTIITVVISALAGYALSRMEFAGRKAIIALIVGSIMIPGQILIVPLFHLMLGLNLVDTYWGIILPQVVAAPMVFILMKFFDQIPRELEEAALMDGASRLKILLSIVLPLSRPILGAVSIFVFIGAWNNFLWPFIVVNDASLMTLPTGLQTVISAYGIQYAQNMAQAMLAALPLIVVFLFFQRQIIKGISTTGIAGA